MQASLAAALRDGGIIAELGKAKEERITNERNKSYPDKAVAAVYRSCALEQRGEHGAGPMAAAQVVPKPTLQPNQHCAAGNGTAVATTGAVKPATDGEQQQLRVGCIVDIPSSPHVPPMRIGEHSPRLQSIPSAAELCCVVLFWSVHIDRKSAAAVLLGLEESHPKDPYAFLARHARLRPLSALSSRSKQSSSVATAHG